MEIKEMAEAVHQTAVEHGWWEERRKIPELLCLVHSEVSEALEAYRMSDEVKFAEELADIVIRVFDIAEAQGINIEKEILGKHEVNRCRPAHHGGKRC